MPRPEAVRWRQRKDALDLSLRSRGGRGRRRGGRRRCLGRRRRYRGRKAFDRCVTYSTTDETERSGEPAVPNRKYEESRHHARESSAMPACKLLAYGLVAATTSTAAMEAATASVKAAATKTTSVEATATARASAAKAARAAKSAGRHPCA